MGGYGSGQSGGRVLTDHCLYLDIGWMLRNGRAEEGARMTGMLRWHIGDEESGSVRYIAIMNEPGSERLELAWRRISTNQEFRQRIDLDYTEPNYGGKRWWLVCPERRTRATKLFLPNSGDKFLSRQAYGLAYRSQRLAPADRPFERLFRLQRMVGSREGWGSVLERPKGMWRRTFWRHWNDWAELEDNCNRTAASMFGFQL